MKNHKKISSFLSYSTTFEFPKQIQITVNKMAKVEEKETASLTDDTYKGPQNGIAYHLYPLKGLDTGKKWG